MSTRPGDRTLLHRFVTPGPSPEGEPCIESRRLESNQPRARMRGVDLRDQRRVIKRMSDRGGIRTPTLPVRSRLLVRSSHAVMESRGRESNAPSPGCSRRRSQNPATGKRTAGVEPATPGWKPSASPFRHHPRQWKAGESNSSGRLCKRQLRPGGLPECVLSKRCGRRDSNPLHPGHSRTSRPL